MGEGLFETLLVVVIGVEVIIEMRRKGGVECNIAINDGADKSFIDENRNLYKSVTEFSPYSSFWF